MYGNPFVDYLDQYNVLSPNHAKIYDEYTYDPGKESYTFKIDTKIEEHLLKLYRDNPHSIILTGNAGDGKTRLCRLVHDSLVEEELTQWPNSGIIDITFEKGTIRIVKDLSELKEDIIHQELSNLQNYINSNHESRVYYLIAANEGKLTKFLSQHEDLSYLRQMVTARFNDNKSNNSDFSIINLLDVTSSVYVDKVLTEWNKEENWISCSNCPIRKKCIIHLNHDRTSREHIQKRLVEQYRLLDYLGTHITMREMLIHISYILTGGYTCKDINNADYKKLEEQSKKPYYQNFYGHEIDTDAFSEMKALRIFRELDPGNQSISFIDDFIMNGDISGQEEVENLHNDLFGNDLDMQFGYFKKRLNIYRDHNKESDDNLIDEWIYKLRRKLFFEVENENYLKRIALLPFQYVQDYEEMIHNAHKKALIRKDLINGLNRAFSKKLVAPLNELHATTENLMIHSSYRLRDVEIEDEKKREDIDHLPSKFFLLVDDEVELSLDLTLFEYLMRLNSGDTHNVLREDVEILIDTFKNELIRDSEPDPYSLNILRYDKTKGLFIEDEILIP
ncbi:hypothetical protein [Gottfriedia acidiceleris]|uniref:hypothetical protein n=1 Tax=Gottfriedia acidiceleris TaxID=371036 RepID=UPI00101BAAF6|nr:hypothetical protein [Gottfriedia acidiceleris]